MALEIQQHRDEQSADEQHEGAGHLGGEPPQDATTADPDERDENRRAVALIESRRANSSNSANVLSPSGRTAGELAELTDDDLDRGAEQKPGHDGPRQELRNPTHPQDTQCEEQRLRTRS